MLKEVRGISRAEFQMRLDLCQKKLQHRQLDGAWIHQPASMFYLSGSGQDGYLFIPAEGAPCLFVSQDEERAREEAAWERIILISGFQDLLERWKDLGYGSLRRLGLEADVTSWKLFMRYQKAFPQCVWEDIGPDLRSLRMVKSSAEVEALRRSAGRHAVVFRYIGEWIRPGMTELEIAAEFEWQARKLGHQGRVRYRGYEQGMPPGVVAAGPNAAHGAGYPWTLTGRGLSPLYPMGAGNRTWEEGQPLVIDYAGVYGDYLVDQTRVYFAGKVPASLHKAQKVAEEIAALVAERARPGITAGELYELAFRKAREAGLAEHFMGWGRQAAYIGHGVGLELNEWPVLARGDRTVLVGGMVIAVEPKFVFPGIGAAGVEDTYVVTEQGAEPLTG
ncbi:MAG: M24 family metallopeptidase [Moorellaceae bacterium]